MLEEALRFFPLGEPQFKADRETPVLVNRYGYTIRRFKTLHRMPARMHARPAVIRWDAFTPDGTWLGIEPSPWWAMKRADQHFFGGL